MMTTTDRLDGHLGRDVHGSTAVEAPNIPADHGRLDAQRSSVGGDPNSEQTNLPTTSKDRSSARANVPADQTRADAQPIRVGGDPNIHSAHGSLDAQPALGAVEQSPHPAIKPPISNGAAPGGASNTPDSHYAFDSQAAGAVGGLSSGDTQCAVDIQMANGVAVLSPPTPTNAVSAPRTPSSALGVPNDRPATMPRPATTRGASLADPFLALAADILDDLERVRIANENRLRQLTRSELDSDGERRGLGFSPDDPVVAAIAGLVAASKALEDDAGKNLAKRLRKHPLGPWVKSMKGVGDKQAARLLAVVGDPYWHSRDDRPRTVSELRSYCGWGDARAQVRRKGEHAAWSDTAKKRTWVIADKCKIMLCAACKATRPEGRIWAEHVDGCTCSPYRVLYDDARRRYEGMLHDVECRRCGPKGKPASAGSPRSPGHQEAMALRVVAKTILRDLWREAKRLHGEASDDA